MPDFTPQNPKATVTQSEPGIRSVAGQKKRPDGITRADQHPHRKAMKRTHKATEGLYKQESVKVAKDMQSNLTSTAEDTSTRMATYVMSSEKRELRRQNKAIGGGSRDR